jgi:carbon storage regulator
MLVLSRRTGEEIVIDGNIRLTIVGIRGGRVQLGVVAPDSVRVQRHEIREVPTEGAGTTVTAQK